MLKISKKIKKARGVFQHHNKKVGSSINDNMEISFFSDMGEREVTDPALKYRHELFKQLGSICKKENEDIIGECVAQIHFFLTEHPELSQASAEVQELIQILPSALSGWVCISGNNPNSITLENLVVHPAHMLLPVRDKLLHADRNLTAADIELQPLRNMMRKLRNILKKITDYQDSLHIDCSDLMVSLAKIASFYKNFIRKLVASDEGTRRTLLEVKAQLIHPELGFFLIDNDLAKKMLCLDDYHQPVKENESGAHAVYHHTEYTRGGKLISDLYMKPANHSTDQINPEAEFAVVNFKQLFADNALIAAPTTWIKLRFVYLDTSKIELIDTERPSHIPQMRKLFLSYAISRLADKSREYILSMYPVIGLHFDEFEKFFDATEYNQIKKWIYSELNKEHDDQHIKEQYPFIFSHVFENRIVQVGFGIQGILLDDFIKVFDLFKFFRESGFDDEGLKSLLMDFSDTSLVDMERYRLFNEKNVRENHEVVREIAELVWSLRESQPLRVIQERGMSDLLDMQSYLKKVLSEDIENNLFIYALLNKHKKLVFNAQFSRIRHWKKIIGFLVNLAGDEDLGLLVKMSNIEYWIKYFDKANLIDAFISSINVEPNDAKPDNIMVIIDRDEQGNVVNCKLSFIDNDMAMKGNIVTAHFENKHYTSYKCILYIMSHVLDVELPRNIKEDKAKMQEIDFLLYVLRCVKSLYFHEKKKMILYKSKIISEVELSLDEPAAKFDENHYATGMKLGLPANFAEKIITRMKNIRNVCAKNARVTIRDLFEAAEPIVARFFHFYETQANRLNYEIAYTEATSLNFIEDVLGKDGLKQRIGDRTIGQMLAKITQTSEDLLKDTLTIPETIIKLWKMTESLKLMEGVELSDKQLDLLGEMNGLTELIADDNYFLQKFGKFACQSVLRGKPEAFATLLSVGLDIDQKAERINTTPLQVFCQSFNSEVYTEESFAKMLLIFDECKGVDASSADASGKAPIQLWFHSAVGCAPMQFWSPVKAHPNFERSGKVLNMLCSKGVNQKDLMSVLENIISGVDNLFIGRREGHLELFMQILEKLDENLANQDKIFSYIYKHANSRELFRLVKDLINKKIIDEDKFLILVSKEKNSPRVSYDILTNLYVVRDNAINLSHNNIPFESIVNILSCVSNFVSNILLMVNTSFKNDGRLNQLLIVNPKLAKIYYGDVSVETKDELGIDIERIEFSIPINSGAELPFPITAMGMIDSVSEKERLVRRQKRLLERKAHMFLTALQNGSFALVENDCIHLIRIQDSFGGANITSFSRKIFIKDINFAISFQPNKDNLGVFNSPYVKKTSEVSPTAVACFLDEILILGFGSGKIRIVNLSNIEQSIECDGHAFGKKVTILQSFKGNNQDESYFVSGCEHGRLNLWKKVNSDYSREPILSGYVPVGGVACFPNKIVAVALSNGEVKLRKNNKWVLLTNASDQCIRHILNIRNNVLMIVDSTFNITFWDIERVKMISHFNKVIFSDNNNESIDKAVVINDYTVGLMLNGSIVMLQIDAACKDVKFMSRLAFPEVIEMICTDGCLVICDIDRIHIRNSTTNKDSNHLEFEKINKAFRKYAIIRQLNKQLNVRYYQSTGSFITYFHERTGTDRIDVRRKYDAILEQAPVGSFYFRPQSDQGTEGYNVVLVSKIIEKGKEVIEHCPFTIVNDTLKVQNGANLMDYLSKISPATNQKMYAYPICNMEEIELKINRAIIDAGVSMNEKQKAFYPNMNKLKAEEFLSKYCSGTFIIHMGKRNRLILSNVAGVDILHFNLEWELFGPAERFSDGDIAVLSIYLKKRGLKAIPSDKTLKLENVINSSSVHMSLSSQTNGGRYQPIPLPPQQALSALRRMNISSQVTQNQEEDPHQHSSNCNNNN